MKKITPEGESKVAQPFTGFDGGVRIPAPEQKNNKKTDKNEQRNQMQQMRQTH